MSTQKHNSLKTKLRFLELDIRVSELQTTRVSVASWEYPVLQAVWGDSVNFANEVLIDRKAPDPADEFRRLANRYGSAEVEGAPFVSAVYGQFGPGVTALAQAIREGTYTGDIVVSERPASDVPVAGAIPDNIANRVDQLEKELADAKALQADLVAVQDDGKNNIPLTSTEIETVKAAAPNSLVEQIEEVEKTPLVVSEAILDVAEQSLAIEDKLPRVEGKLSDDEIVDLIGDVPSAA